MAENSPENRKPKPSQPPEGYGFFDLIWLALKDIPSIIRSLNFAVWVIVILALFTMAGTVLPQENLSSDLVDFGLSYEALFNVNPDDGVFTSGEFLYHRLIVPLELYRIFDTGLYFTLVLLLVISASLCAWDRIWISKKLLKATRPSTTPSTVSKMPNSDEGVLDMGIDDATSVFRSFLHKHRFQVFEKTDENGKTGFFIRKNSIHHIATVVFHFALVLILIGGVIGDERVSGFEGNMVIAEGAERPLGNEIHASEIAASAGDHVHPATDEMIRLVEYENIYREEDFPGIDTESGFPLEYMGSPSDYLSQLQIVSHPESGDEEILVERTIEVNFPLRYRGVAYYQSSINNRVTLSAGEPGTARTTTETFLNEPFVIQPLGFECLIRPSDIVGGYFVSSDGTRTPVPYTVRLVDYSLYRQGLSERPVLLGYISEGWPITISGVEISLDGIEEYTIIHFVHDPGVPFVYVGGFILMLGLIFSLYLPWRTGRIVLVPEGNRTRWVAGGNWRGFTDFIEPIKNK